MQEAEEQDTCRICSAPGEPDQPLFYPCKCSGTIRYIHQDCLTTWLAHSKKKTCDVCKHPYSFTKVYAVDMPLRLPPVLLIRRLAQQCLLAVIFALRAVVVGIVWLAVLPWATVWTWRMYFTMGDSTAWWISDRPRPASSIAAHNPFYSYHNASSEANSTSTSIANTTLLERTMSRPFWRAMSADIFAGQIIAALIVLTFVAVFLLREWISQNARPGVFEDEEFLEMPPLIEQAALPPVEPPEQRRHTPPPEVPAHVIPLQAYNAPPVIPPLANRSGADHRGPRRQRRHLVGQSAKRAETSLRNRREKGKGKARRDSYTASEADDSARDRARARRRIHSSSDAVSDDSDDRDEDYSRNLRDVLGDAATRRQEIAKAESASSSSALDASGQGKFEFTFRASSELPLRQRSIPGTSSSPAASESNSSTPIYLFQRDETTEDPTASPASSSSTLSSPPSPTSGIPSLNPSVAERLFTSKPSTPSSVRRPPMPSTTLPTPNVVGPSTPPSVVTKSRAQTPLASPSLATYRAPEELEGEPSRLTGYFDAEGLAEAELKKEHQFYFRPSLEEASPQFLDKNRPVIPQMERVNGDLEIDDADDDEDDDDDEAEDMDGSYEYVVADDDDEDEEDEGEGEGVPIAGVHFDGEAEWADEADHEEDVEEAPVHVVRNIEQQPAPAPLADAEAGDINDDLEGNVEDDMEGAMEAIGMRGPIYGVIQNAALMVFVLDTAIGLGVWLPFTIGKSTALLSLDPHRFLQIIHLPIRAMRIITDPVVDSVAFLIRQFFLPPFFQLFQTLLRYLIHITSIIFTKIAGQSNADNISERFITMSSEVADYPFQKALQWISTPGIHTNPEPPSSNVIDAFFESNSTIVRLSEPYFAALGKEIRVTATHAKHTWIRLALGYGTTEKIFAVVLGYTVVGLLLALYLNILTVGNVKSAGRAVRSAVRQQLLVFKVAVFIIIELVVFPLGCGIMLDICSVWLFPEANLQTRAVFFTQAPLTAMFYHWVAGTMFMYQFAILLAGCRGIMRPGAMWFIKDPQDQNFHPIRDILDRPTLTQLRKLLISAMMYSIVVALGVGSVAGLLFAGFNSILPLRWKTREPLSDVPIDLLFLHFVLPYTMHYFRPKKILTQVVMFAWKHLARQLRLTSYMFGDRYPMEEFTPHHSGWTSFILKAIGVYDPSNIHDGTFRRVPASDNVALPRDMRATAEVDTNGEPANDAAARLIQMQDAEADKAKRNVKADYTIVYIPPHFRYRIILFIFSLWVAFAIVFATVFSVPILLGRGFFKLFSTRDVHDGYSFISGFYLLWGCYIIAKAVDRMDKRRQRRGHDGPRPEFSVFLVKRSLLWFAKISYMLFFLGVVIPILISLVIDFYIVLPIRLAVNPDLKPHIRIVDTWALGLLYAKIAVHAHRLQHPTPTMQGLNNIANNGWTHPDPIIATKEVIGPVTGGLALLLVFPAAIILGLRHFFSLNIGGKFIFMHVYPGLFAVIGFGRSVMVGIELMASWSQSIRDKEFLVEMRLRNHDPTNEEKRETDTGEVDLSDN